MQILELLLLAALAVLALGRLYMELGKNSGSEQPQPQRGDAADLQKSLCLNPCAADLFLPVQQPMAWKLLRCEIRYLTRMNSWPALSKRMR